MHPIPAQRERSEPATARPPAQRLVTLHQRGGIAVRLVRRLATECRSLLLRLRGASIGRGVFIGTDAQFYGFPGVRIGSGVNIGRRARIEAHLTDAGRASLSIGPGSHIGNDFHAGAALSVAIGRNCMFASGVTVLDHDHDFAGPPRGTGDDAPRQSDAALRACHAIDGVVASPTVIEDGVFLGERVVVLKGVRIGSGSVIGANSVVANDIPPGTMAAGLPARPIRRWCETSRAWVKLDHHHLPADGPSATASRSNPPGVAA